MDEHITIKYKVPLRFVSQDGHRSWTENAEFEATGTPEQVEIERQKFLKTISVASS